MAKPKTVDEAPEQGRKPSRRKLVIVLSAAVAVLVLGSGAYVATQPSEAKSAEARPAPIPVPMPAATVAAAQPVSASDYEIVSIFGDEAILAAGSNLVRVKVGSVAPALGTVIEVTQTGAGGTVVGTEATLRTL